MEIEEIMKLKSKNVYIVLQTMSSGVRMNPHLDNDTEQIPFYPGKITSMRTKPIVVFLDKWDAMKFMFRMQYSQKNVNLWEGIGYDVREALDRKPHQTHSHASHVIPIMWVCNLAEELEKGTHSRKYN